MSLLFEKCVHPRPPFVLFSKRKAVTMDFEKWGGGEGLCLHSQEDQVLCVCTEIFAMVVQWMEDKRTGPLTSNCQWLREGGDL